LRRWNPYLVGTWLSLVEHSLGVRGVGSSNLPVPTKMSLKSNLEAYLQELLLSRRISTHNRSKQILFEALPFLTEPDPRPGVISYLTTCKERGNTNRTLANKLVRLSAFCRTQGIKLSVPKPKFVTRVPEVYAQADIERFFAACTERQRLYFRTLLYSGLRIQEVRYLEWADIEDGVICVRAKPHWVPKTSEERRIPVPRALTAELLAGPRMNHLVFPTALGNYACHALRTCKRIARRAGLLPAGIFSRWSWMPLLPGDVN
jgi:integrase